MPSTRSTWHGTLSNLLLLAGSVLFALLLLEGTLRFLFPVYQYAAESQFEENANRIWSRQPKVSYVRSHPDNDSRHDVIYNSHAMRQHREFDPGRIRAGINIGFFGDSFVENLRIAAPYMFTEILDYLLNEAADQPVTVMNYGVDGYGTGQSYLYYKESTLAKELNYVFYVLCINDLNNIFQNDLFSLDESGQLVRKAVSPTPWYVRVPSRLHITYLWIDLRNRLVTGSSDQDRIPTAKQFAERFQRKKWRERKRAIGGQAIERTLTGSDDDDYRTIQIFRKILESWRREAEAQGAEFFVVLLPREDERIAEPALAKTHALINLYKLAKQRDSQFEYDAYSLRDGHWDERGNLLAAELLFEYLTDELQLEPRPDDWIERAVSRYYASFDGLAAPEDISVGNVAGSKAIEDRYLALQR